ncbi:Gfo/Idh/MocA family protein [Microbacterium rhizophilus]|uniref:Gfo/Idh/MocA family protein n=1 Tax=Microbacterium rhizophilus TaxID=3138934 RepID=UPI0031EB8C98
MVRTIIIGVSHWHLNLFLKPLRARDDIEFVGISDPDAEIAGRVADDLSCAAFARYEDLVADAKPDFAIVLGPHHEMAATASFLIAAGIPFAIEKPAGLDGAEVAAIADQAETAGAFAAVPFVFRQGDFIGRMREQSAGERFDHLSFTMIGRPPQQYDRLSSPWMLDRRTSGGGAMINLGIHFLDLVPHLVPDEPVEILSAAMSNAAWGLPIEDFAAVTLRIGSSIATIQTGYRYPSPDQYMDLHFSLRTASHYYVVRDGASVEVSGTDGTSETWQVGTTNMPYYPRFVDDTIERVKRGDKPFADLRDAARATALLDRVYEAAGIGVRETEGA